MTQYDQIAADYNQSEQLFYRHLESKLMQNVLAPELAGRRGLKLVEFAAGTGFYTSRVFAWAPAAADVRITAMDISQAMLDINAQRHAAEVSAGRLRLIKADGAEPQSYAPPPPPPPPPSDDDDDDDSGAGADGYFDGAFGGWFFNYALSRASLRAMFDNVALNLRPGGFFVGVVPYPTEDVAARLAALRAPAFDDMWPKLRSGAPLEDGSGWRHSVSITETVAFEAAHLRRSVYEEVAREAGFGDVAWFLGDLPREEVIGPGVVLAAGGGDWTEEQYDLWKKVGVLGVMRMYKK